MPVFHGSMAAAPAWCELSSFAIVRLPAGARHEFARVAPKERLIVAAGSCRLIAGAEEVEATAGAKHELAGTDGHFAIAAVHEPATVVHLGGTWGEETGGWGLFTVEEVADPIERGDPTDYSKLTRIDNHYHDCDEYWIVLEGAGTAVSEGRHYEVAPGDCVATGMGHHHDFPLATAPVRAVYFETTLMGERRRGHLWEHTHGPARPQPGRC